MNCVFCVKIFDRDYTVRSAYAAAFPDNYPVSRGHHLVVPIHHESSYLELDTYIQQSIWSVANEICLMLSNLYSPTGFNLGFNIGKDAGQTIPHAHLHIIPRYPHDVDDPKGGVRWVIPRKAKYWQD